MIKLIAIDIDGTLLNDKLQITAATKKAIAAAKAKQVKIVLTSGRPLPGIQPQLEILDLWYQDNYTIASNGATAQENNSQRVLIEQTLTINDFKFFAALAQVNDMNLVAQDRNYTYTLTTHDHPLSVAESQKVHLPLRHVTLADLDPDLKLAKIMYVDYPDKLAHFIPKVPKSAFKQYTLLHSIPTVFEAMNPAASKGQTLAKLAEKLGINASEVMAIGDEANDLSMLEYAGVGVAMGNGTVAAKTAADFITKTNNQDGVATAIDYFVLQ
ncbi:Cof-type HAD-IIB family hydrolase [Agrilactobacillus fermenti]|uniref:Cof-type HAD-IIB family hydrolase n=1 Tax=Agrilactobacillus fermenti TaxID=2586909 RepID=UPI001E606C44|nr:Cof-type HAD-IIB family hydrolase [Agrilactobacillus fermenti]MCD2256461.1 Cof-type HAD-IIB family hydrolase [Agrilactobacillus fermenti]